jgi:hypothetical protein
LNPTQHPSNTTILHPPPGVPNDVCRPLAITRFTYGDGSHAVSSYWRPTDAERAAIAAGALVCFTAQGSTHPPVLLTVDGVTTP